MKCNLAGTEEANRAEPSEVPAVWASGIVMLYEKQRFRWCAAAFGVTNSMVTGYADLKIKQIAAAKCFLKAEQQNGALTAGAWRREANAPRS
ncbi:MAG: hypothetical protein P4L80_16420 [Xanthobacteraceae bacterium]|nr:hypothetical protein [Xanthobacteraceae bacterium]